MDDFIVGCAASDREDLVASEPLNRPSLLDVVIGQTPGEFDPLKVSDPDDVSLAEPTLKVDDPDRQQAPPA